MDGRTHDFEEAKSAESAVAPFAPRAAPFAPDWPKTGDEAIIVGSKLIAIRDGMRGTFKSWVEANCPYSYRRAAEWMKLARDASKPVDELYLACLAPTEFGEPTLTDDEIETFASIALEGVPSDEFSGTERFIRADRVIGFIGTAIHNAPNATFGELLRAVRRAKSDAALIEGQLDALASILMAQPADGLIGSCALLKGVTNTVPSDQIFSTGDEPNDF